MGHSQSEKAGNHTRILQIAAARFRELGLAGLSVADLMKEAGLTHGGFYRHFESREDLVAEAVAFALAEGQTRVGVQPRPALGLTLEALIDAYLDEAHRDAPARGCAVAALAADAGRSDVRTRAEFTRQVKRNLKSMTQLLQTRGGSSKRARAILIWSALVGALTLARAVNEKRLSSEILRAVRSEIKALSSDGKPNERSRA
jgi:TetR/AcrR family transcriptional repressor of nem operon